MKLLIMSIHTEHPAPPYLIIGRAVPVEHANILYFGDKSKYLPKISILILTFALLRGYKVIKVVRL